MALEAQSAAAQRDAEGKARGSRRRGSRRWWGSSGRCWKWILQGWNGTWRPRGHPTRQGGGWGEGAESARWAAAAFLDPEKGYRRTMGYKDLSDAQGRNWTSSALPRL